VLAAQMVHCLAVCGSVPPQEPSAPRLPQPRPNSLPLLPAAVPTSIPPPPPPAGEAEGSYFHTSRWVSTAACNVQTIGRDVLYTPRVETRLRTGRRNKVALGALCSKLGEDYSHPFKVRQPEPLLVDGGPVLPALCGIPPSCVTPLAPRAACGGSTRPIQSLPVLPTAARRVRIRPQDRRPRARAAKRKAACVG
jgi:hypothetical protein